MNVENIKGTTRFSRVKCNEMGLSAIRVHHIFNRVSRPADLDELVKLAEGLGCKISALPFLTDQEKQLMV